MKIIRHIMPQVRGLGDVAYGIAQPVAKVVDRVFKTDLKNCGGCKSRREKWNEKYPF